MRHRKHNHQLGVKSAHRVALVANLACALIRHGRIRTTLAKAKALRPAVEKIITLAKKAHLAEDAAKKVHLRRLAISRLRDKKVTKKLFDELAEEFVDRSGGYTRIYKLAIPRRGDAADMALIELVLAGDEGYSKKKKRKKAPKESKAPAEEKPAEETAEKANSEEQASEEPLASAEQATESEDAAEEATSEKQPEAKEEPAEESDSEEDSAEEETSDKPEAEGSAEEAEKASDGTEETESEGEDKKDG